METIPFTFVWWIILVFGIIPCSPLVVGLIKNPEDKSHTALTWGLYTTLDSLTLFSGKEVRINLDPMVLGFAIGSLIMTTILLYQKRYATWGYIESLMIVLICYCIFSWKVNGSMSAFEACILSELITGVYLIKQTIDYPRVAYNFQGYLLFLFVSIMSLFSSEKWTVSEAGFAVVEVFLNIIILIPLSIRWNKDRKNKIPGK